MKIIVPIDYSTCSYYAIQAAKLILKNQKDPEIVLFYAREVLEKADYELERVKDEFKKLSITVSYIESEGEFISSFKIFMDSQDCDLIVIGSHGASGKKEWFLGSNAQKVIRKIRFPILTVKSSISSLNFNEVCFVTGMDYDDQEVFRRFLKMLALFQVKEVHLLSIDTRSFFSQPTFLMMEALKDFKRIGEEHNISAHFYPDYSVESGIRHFTQERGIDLVGISNHKRHPIKRIFQGSTVEMVVNHLDVPVLSMDYNDK